MDKGQKMLASIVVISAVAVSSVVVYSVKPVVKNEVRVVKEVVTSTPVLTPTVTPKGFKASPEATHAAVLKAVK